MVNWELKFGSVKVKFLEKEIYNQILAYNRKKIAITKEEDLRIIKGKNKNHVSAKKSKT